MLLVLTAGLLIGCEPNDPPLTGPDDFPPPSAQADAAPKPALARVNGRAIYMQQLHEVLVANFGMPLADQLVANEVVAQEAVAQGLTASEAEIERETDRALARLSPQQVTDPAQREALLEQILQQRGLPREMWHAAMKRNVLLRKMAEGRVSISEDDLREQFERHFGRKVKIRLLEVPTLAAAQEALRALEDGDDFVALVRQHSTHASQANDGLLAPISAASVDISPAIRQAAVALAEIGQISNPVRTGTHYYLLQLVEIVPMQEADYAVVRDQLREAVRRRQIDEFRRTILRDLLRNADIVFVDPTLRRQAARRSADGP